MYMIIKWMIVWQCWQNRNSAWTCGERGRERKSRRGKQKRRRNEVETSIYISSCTDRAVVVKSQLSIEFANEMNCRNDREKNSTGGRMRIFHLMQSIFHICMKWNQVLSLSLSLALSQSICWILRAMVDQYWLAEIRINMRPYVCACLNVRLSAKITRIAKQNF